MQKRVAIILAAGKGTRMKSALPKVMHPVGGRPMLEWSISLAERCNCQRIVVVISPTQSELSDYISARLGSDAIAIQEQPRGTGHAVAAALPHLTNISGNAVILYGDTPLIPEKAVEGVFSALNDETKIGVLGFEAENPGAYGRLIENSQNGLDAIVEAKDATEAQRAIKLCNSGVMGTPLDYLHSAVNRIDNENAKQEFYLTDMVGIARADGHKCAVIRCDEADVLGVNSKSELARAEAIFQRSMRIRAMDDGVTLVAPETVFFSYDTRWESDVLIEPNVVIGPDVYLRKGACIRAFSHIEGADIGQDAIIGPYARIRPGTHIGARGRIGNFVEVKNTILGEGTKANHLAYLGDASVGKEVNVGAGAIFCNYDGFDKHKTTIGDSAFIGSNAALVAPLKVGGGAMIGSGSVITNDIEDDALGLARIPQTQKPNWAKRFRAAKKARNASKT